MTEIREAALSAVERVPWNDSEPGQLGDIVAIREPVHWVDYPGKTTAQYMGTKEMKFYIWIRLQGLSANEFGKLKEPMWHFRGFSDGEPDLDRFEKFRYCIPFSRLAEIVPFDMVRAVDTTDAYQPFLEAGENGFYLTSECCPLDVHGLVWDKQQNRFL